MKKLDSKIKKLIESERVEVLAFKVGVCTSTVEKWKAGKFMPSRLAQEKLSQLFREKQESSLGS